MHLKQPIGIVPSPELTLGVDVQSETLLDGLYLQDTNFPFLSSNPWVAIYNKIVRISLRLTKFGSLYQSQTCHGLNEKYIQLS